MAAVISAWATLRFRRSKDVKGWALLGIPQRLYPDVMQPLFERQARFIEKHGRGEFVNVLFEAPIALAARLALAFPAPPSCEPLTINQAGNRLLYGKFANSAKARHQAKESDAWPGLKLLNGDESFWQVVATLSSVTTLPLDRLHPAGNEDLANPVSTDTPSAFSRTGTHLPSADPSKKSAAQTALHNLVQDGLKLESAAALNRPSRSAEKLGCGPRGRAQNLDEEGFEEDDWEDQEVGGGEEEAAFEDVWDTDESTDFWDGSAQPSPALVPLSQPLASLLPQEKSEVPGQIAGAGSAEQGFQSQDVLIHRHQGSLLQGEKARPASIASPRRFDLPMTAQSGSQEREVASYEAEATVSRFSVADSVEGAASFQVTGLEPEKHDENAFVSQAPQVNSTDEYTSTNHAPGRYRSGLVPHPSDASSLQIYNSGGLTVADAIARSRQQEVEEQAIAEQAQHRRIKLPFEQSSACPSSSDGPLPENGTRPSWSYGGAVPQLPEESWAISAQAAQPAVPLSELEDAPHFTGQAEAFWGGSVEELPVEAVEAYLAHNPWRSPEPPLGPAVESAPPWAVTELDLEQAGTLTEAVEWGYYDEQGLWIPCDPVIPATSPLDSSTHLQGALVPVSTEVVCTPVEEEMHDHILRQGVAAWNDWRLANPQIRPNLRGAYLNNLDLAGADLHDADLCFAVLFRADLREADLSLAALAGADLIRADLGGSSLWGASLRGAYLSHANLAGAELTQADLQGVYWQGAILTGAVMPDGRLFENQY